MRVRLGQRDRNQSLIVFLAEALEAVSVDGHEIPLPVALGIQAVVQDVFVAEVVTLEIGVIGGGRQIKAPSPPLGQPEAAFAFDRAAEGVARRLWVALLLDRFAADGAAARELEGAALQQVAVFGRQHRILLGVKDRRQRDVVVRRQGEVVWGLDGQPENAVLAEGRHQDAGAALDRRIRVGEVGRVEDRDAGQLEEGVVIDDVLGGLVVNDASRRDLPERRRGRVRAKRAWREHRPVEYRAIASGPSAALRRDQRVVDQPRAQLCGDALPKVAAQGDAVGEQRVAGGLEQGHVAFGLHYVGVAVVAQRVREQAPLAAGDLHVAGCRDHVFLDVVVDPVGDQQHLPLAQIEGATRRGSDQEPYQNSDDARDLPAGHGRLSLAWITTVVPRRSGRRCDPAPGLSSGSWCSAIGKPIGGKRRIRASKSGGRRFPAGQRSRDSDRAWLSQW